MMCTENIVKPVIVIMNLSPGRHIGDWFIQILSYAPYFLSAGCHSYASYVAFHVHHMKLLDAERKQHDRPEETTVWRILTPHPGHLHSIRKDMFI